MLKKIQKLRPSKNEIWAFFCKKFIDISFLALAIGMGFYLNWSMLGILIFGIFIWMILNPFSSRLLAFASLGFLVITPFLYVFNQKIISEQFAIYAYYFLVMTVIMAIYELKKEGWEK